MGGHGGYSDTGLEPVSGSTAAQAWDGGNARRDRQQAQPLETYQAPDQGYAQPQQQADPYSATAGGAPGASYARPGEEPVQRQSYPQPQQQTYRPQPQPQQSDGYADPTANATGPASTSRGGVSQRQDDVGYAGVRGVAGGDNGSVVMVHRSLPSGTFVEITSLETGKTIIALVTGTSGDSDRLADLSPTAAQMLGSNSTMIPVRIRTITPTGQDQAALMSGKPATERPDTPPVLLNALRKNLPAAAVATRPAPSPSYTRPATGPARPATTTAPRGGAGFYVQVGAFSNQANANGLAQSLGGFVKPGGSLYRVQMGPYRTAGEAQAARAEAARRGYGDAKVLSQN